MHPLALLKKDRVAALANAEACAIRAKGTDAEDADLASAEQMAALDLIDELDAKIKTEQARMDAAAAQSSKLAERMGRIRVPNAPAPRSGGVTRQRDSAQDDPNAGFATSRDFVLAVISAGVNGRADDRLLPLRAAAGSDEQGEYSNAFGGFLVPAGHAPNLLSVVTEADPTAGRTTALPMNSNSVSVNARVDKDHSTSVTGGMRFYRRSETGTGTASRTQFEQVTLKANSLMGLNYTTEELLADSPISLAALIQSGFRQELGAKLLEEKIRGTGVNQFLGVLNAPCKIAVAKESAQAADTINYTNILKMRSRCWGYDRAIWLANHDTIPQLGKLALEVGTSGGSAVYQPSAVEDRPDLLLGRPIFYTEFAETIGDEGDVILADWSQYLEASLQAEQMSESIHVRFDTNERAFKVTLRNDGRPWWNTALTPRKGASLSPIVTLAVR